MKAALYIYLLLACGIGLVTYLLQISGRMVPIALIGFLIIGKIVFAVLSTVLVLVWYLIDAESCRAEWKRHQALKS